MTRRNNQGDAPSSHTDRGTASTGGDTGEPTRRRTARARDPQARRDALAAAVLQVVAEVGIGRTTHRAVAARAELPLGATTYYFPTLDDLIAAGLHRATGELETELRAWATRLAAGADLPTTLVGVVEEYLTDRSRARIEYELYVEAARDVRLRPLAVAWLHGLRALLTPYVGEVPARDVAALLDGAMLQALVTGADLDGPGLAAAVRRLTAP